MSEKLFWALVLGIIGGFSFAVGAALYEKAGKKFGLGDATVTGVLGSST